MTTKKQDRLRSLTVEDLRKCFSASRDDEVNLRLLRTELRRRRTQTSTEEAPARTDRIQTPAPLEDAKAEFASLAPYVEANLGDLYRDARALWTTSRLQTLALQVVESEGPVHHDVVIERLRIAFRRGRITGHDRETALYALRLLAESGQCATDEEFHYLNNAQLTRAARVAGKRRADLIHVSEIDGALLLALKDLGGGSEDQLVRHCAHMLGYRRIGRIIRHRLRGRTRHLMQDGSIRLSGGFLEPLGGGERAVRRASEQPTSESMTSQITIEAKEVEYSPLTDVGYSSFMSKGERWKLLRDVAIPMYGAEGVINMLRAFIDRGRASENDFSRAISEWEHDLAQVMQIR